MDHDQNTPEERRAGMRRSIELQAAIEEQLDERGKQLLGQLLDQHSDSAHASYTADLEELFRHFPSLSAAMRAVYWHHVVEKGLDDRGACCR